MAKLRVKNKLSQQFVAELLNVALSTYKRYEAGTRIMNLEEINILSNFYNVSLNSLLNITKNTISYNTFKDIDYKYLRFSLKFIRQRNRVRQQDLETYFNLSRSTISRYEKHPELAKLNYFILFAKKFKVSLDYMCGKTLKREIF